MPVSTNVVVETEVSKAVIECYTNIRSLLEQSTVEDEGQDAIPSDLAPLQVPRLCICGEQTSGKSALVEQFIGFPCSLSKQDTGTRCPVSYLLRRNPNQVEPVVTKPIGATKVTLMAAVAAHMKSLGESFTAQPYRVEIECATYQDFELYDLPGFRTNTTDADRLTGEAKAAADEIKKINQRYVRNADFQIVLVILAQRDAATAAGISVVEELCIKADKTGEHLPPRHNWRDSVLYVGTHFDFLTISTLNQGKLANEMLAKRDLDLKRNAYGEYNVVYTCLLGNAVGDRDNYAVKQGIINTMEAVEKKMYDDWVDRMHVNEGLGLGKFDQDSYAYGARVGVRQVQSRMHGMWFRAFIQRLPTLYNQLYAQGEQLVKDYWVLSKQESWEQRSVTISTALKAYVVKYLTQMRAVYKYELGSTRTIYAHARQSWGQELSKALQEPLPEFYQEWGSGASNSESKLKALAASHSKYDAFLKDLDTPMIGVTQVERVIRVWQFLILHCQPECYERVSEDEVMSSLETSRQSGAPSPDMVIRATVDVYVRSTFVSSWQWLVWRIQTLIAQWQASVHRYLLTLNEFQCLENSAAFLSFFSHIDVAYTRVINDRLLKPATSTFALIRDHRAEAMMYNFTFRVLNALTYTKRRAPVNADEHTLGKASLTTNHWDSTGIPLHDSFAMEVEQVIYKWKYGQVWPIDTENRAACHALVVELVQERFGLLKHMLLMDAEVTLTARVLHPLHEGTERNQENPGDHSVLLRDDDMLAAVSVSWGDPLVRAKEVATTMGDDVQFKRDENRIKLATIKKSAEDIKTALQLLQRYPDLLYWTQARQNDKDEGAYDREEKTQDLPSIRASSVQVVRAESLRSLHEWESVIAGTGAPPPDAGNASCTA